MPSYIRVDKYIEINGAYHKTIAVIKMLLKGRNKVEMIEDHKEELYDFTNRLPDKVLTNILSLILIDDVAKSSNLLKR